MRLLRRVYERTHDPLFLAVPRELMVAGFGEKAKDIKTRDTGLVFNYLPWFMDLLETEGRPAPDPEFSITAKSTAPRACFELSNTGDAPITDLRVSFQARLDYTAGRAMPPDSLAPGQSAHLCYALERPAAINLTSQYNRVSYAHCSASGRRAGKPVLAHAWIKLEEEPGLGSRP
jgi:hypothetical protein